MRKFDLLRIPFPLPTANKDVVDEAIDQALGFTGGDAQKVADGLHLTRVTVERRLGKQMLGRLTSPSHQQEKGSPDDSLPLPAGGQEN